LPQKTADFLLAFGYQDFHFSRLMNLSNMHIVRPVKEKFTKIQICNVAVSYL